MAEPEALRLRVPQGGLIASGRKILNIEQEISNRRGKANPHFEIRYSLFDILRFKCTSLKLGLREAKSTSVGKHTPENVKLLLPHRQSRWISQRICHLVAAAGRAVRLIRRIYRQMARPKSILRGCMPPES